MAFVMRHFKIGILLCFSLSMFLRGQESPILIYQAAQYAEEVYGELHEAVRLYKKVVDHADSDPELAAWAQFHIGRCYEKMRDPGASDAYQKVIKEYPKQTEAAAMARARLAVLAGDTKRIHPLVNFYFQRTGIDPYSSTSHDGNYFAFTDWNTGNLAVKNLATDEVVLLTDTDWSRSQEYAMHPAWSRDGTTIAFSWHRGFFSTELRTVTLTDKKIRKVWSSSDCLIYPQDWSPDGNTILFETYDYRRTPSKKMALFSLKDSTFHEPVSVDGDARGFQFSPDGNWIAFDWAEENNRHIYLFSTEDQKPIRITRGAHGRKGFDNPVWTADGKHILCRSFRLSQFDLWEIPIDSDLKPGPLSLIQADLTQAVLSMRSVDHYSSLESRSFSSPKSTGYLKAEPFFDDFSSPVLDSVWTVNQWEGPNVYGYDSFGRYSLTDRPGHLRFYLDPMMDPGYGRISMPKFSGWYWFYTPMEIGRTIYGHKWELETKVTYRFNEGTNTQKIDLCLSFDPDRFNESILWISRGTKISPSSGIGVAYIRQRTTIDHWNKSIALPDTLGMGQNTYTFRIRRNGQRIEVDVSENDSYFSQILSFDLPESVQNTIQYFFLTGECWFVPAGAYADWDYFRFRPLEEDE